MTRFGLPMCGAEVLGPSWSRLELGVPAPVGQFGVPMRALHEGGHSVPHFHLRTPLGWLLRELYLLPRSQLQQFWDLLPSLQQPQRSHLLPNSGEVQGWRLEVFGQERCHFPVCSKET